MKKLLYKEYSYKMILYPVNYKIVFTTNVQDYVWKTEGRDVTGAGACTIHGTTGPVIVVLPKQCPEEYLFHEVAHLAQCILGRCGVKYDYENQEPLAYVLGHVMRNAVRANASRKKDKWKEL